MDEVGKSSTERAVSDSAIDFDLMDELLSGDCWVETPNYSELFQQSTSASTSTFCSSPFFPLLDIAINNNVTNALETENMASEPKMDLSIQPRGPIVPMEDRLSRALGFIKESQRGSDVLVQIWAPAQREGRNFLTTCGQPFWLDSDSQSLSLYRSVSTHYQFSVEQSSDEIVGLPGRVFLGKVPEWTPDVRYFSRDEYARVNDAQRYEVCGTIALPVFEREGRSCLGVVELVLTTQKISYSSDLENICNALQAVDLRSSDVLGVPQVKVSNNTYQAALPEIQEVLKAICETHGLPLAQTWITCIQQGKQGSRHSNQNYKECVSTVDHACYVNDPSMLRFHVACSEHHLFRGQGVAGKAFTTNQPCFSPDITSFTKTQYPLSHHAKLFNLKGAVAIRLRSIHTGKADFVLEFFLPINCVESEEQKLMLNSLSITIQQVCKSLRVVTAKEMEEDAMFENNELCPLDLLFDKSVSKEGLMPDDGNILSACSPSVGISNIMEIQEKEGTLTAEPSTVHVEWDNQEIEEFKVDTNWDAPECKQQRQSTPHQENFFPGDPNILRAGKSTEKRRAKSEKTVSLQVLRQYFAGSLKDAAKSIGVCPTTLKRICRQHGITRWPSRKIKKVGYSLKKLQVVMDSVQGAEGTFQFSSVYENFAKVSGPDKNSPLNQIDHPESSNTIPQQGRFSSYASASNSQSSSSCSKSSKSSGSSFGCPSGLKQLIHSPRPLIKQQAFVEENQIAELQRANSGAELNFSGQEPRRSLENPSQLPKKRSNYLFKVKAVYGEEKVRFKLQPNWSFQELKQETMNRFNIAGASSVDLKYLDDDSEWVLLTCDEDLQECVDVYRSCSGDTIKLSVHCASQRDPRVSFGFQAPP